MARLNKLITWLVPANSCCPVPKHVYQFQLDLSCMLVPHMIHTALMVTFIPPDSILSQHLLVFYFKASKMSRYQKCKRYPHRVSAEDRLCGGIYFNKVLPILDRKHLLSCLFSAITWLLLFTFFHFLRTSSIRSSNRSVVVSGEGWQRQPIGADHRGGPSACLHRRYWCIVLDGSNGIQCLDLLQTQEEKRTWTLHYFLCIHTRR